MTLPRKEARGHVNLISTTTCTHMPAAGKLYVDVTDAAMAYVARKGAAKEYDVPGGRHKVCVVIEAVGVEVNVAVGEIVEIVSSVAVISIVPVRIVVTQSRTWLSTLLSTCQL